MSTAFTGMDELQEAWLYGRGVKKKRVRLFKRQRDKIKRRAVTHGESMPSVTSLSREDFERFEDKRKAVKWNKSLRTVLKLFEILRVARSFSTKVQITEGLSVDFYSPQLFLAIDVALPDESKKRQLYVKGIHLVSYSEFDVMKDTARVMNDIRQEIWRAQKLARLRRKARFCKVYLAGDYSQERLQALVPWVA